MRRRLAPSAAVLSLLLLLLVPSSCFQAAEAETFVGGTADWTFVSRPTVSVLGISPAAATTFTNHLDVSVLGIVIMVIHNSAGQTVYYSTATLNITRGFSGTAYTVEAGLPPGIYNATIFAFSTSGVAISSSTTIPFPAR